MGQSPEKTFEIDKNEIPMGMSVVEPPQGTEMYNVGDNHFGVKSIFKGLIITFGEPPNRSAMQEEGTLINFGPGHVKAHVKRCDLAADEINKIGKFCVDIESSMLMLEFLPTTIKQTSALIRELKSLTSLGESPLLQRVSEMGVIVDELEKNIPKKREDYYMAAKNLNGLGVTLVEGETSSSKRGGYPIPLIVARRAQE